MYIFTAICGINKHGTMKPIAFLFVLALCGGVVVVLNVKKQKNTIMT